MKKHFFSYKLLLILPVLVLYNNCGGFKKSEDTLLGSNNCKVSANLSLKLLKFDAQEDCGDFSQISCEQRVFSPMVESSTLQLESCIDPENTDPQCIEYTQRNYNTAAAEGFSEDFIEGGDYNNSEFNCYNKRLTHFNKPIFKTTASSLKEAVDKLYAQCAQREVQ